MVLKHALRNALVPVVTVIGLSFANLLAGTVLTERIFAWPGIGSYAFQASTSLDFPAIMGVSLLIAFIFIVTNLVVDVLYFVLDPRLRRRRLRDGNCETVHQPPLRCYAASCGATRWPPSGWRCS